MTDADLDRPSHEKMKFAGPTLGHVLMFVALHTIMHAGQFTVILVLVYFFSVTVSQRSPVVRSKSARAAIAKVRLASSPFFFIAPSLIGPPP